VTRIARIVVPGLPHHVTRRGNLNLNKAGNPEDVGIGQMSDVAAGIP
jgi:hypothetical protein